MGVSCCDVLFWSVAFGVGASVKQYAFGLWFDGLLVELADERSSELAG